MVRDTILFKHISQLNLYFCIHLLCIVGMIEKAVFYAEYQSVANNGYSGKRMNFILSFMP